MFIRRFAISIAAAALALVAVLASTTHNASTVAKASGCDDSTIQGVYTGTWNVIAFSGKNPPTRPQLIGRFYPSSVNAVVSFDGGGNWASTGTTNFGGTYGPFNIHGPYSVRADCTGHLQEPGLA